MNNSRGLLEVYIYSLRKVAPTYVSFVLGGVGFFALLITLLRSNSLNDAPLAALCILYFMPIICVLLILGFIFVWSPLSVGETEVAQLIFGYRWRFVRWDEVERIESAAFSEQFSKVIRREMKIISGNKFIRVDDYLERFESCSDRIHQYASLRSIPVVEYGIGGTS